MRRFSFILALYAIFLVGCGMPGDQIIDDAPQRDGSKPAAPKMSDVGDYLPILDRGRVKIAPPKGWYTLPRNPKYLVRFTPERGDSYPAIIVTVKPFEEIKEVTTENLKKYAKLLDDPGKDLQLRHIEQFVAVSYTKQGVLKDGLRTIPLDRIFFDTVVDHRRYQFELRAKAGSLDKSLPDLIGVAVKTRFLKRQGVEELESFDDEEAASETLSPKEPTDDLSAPKAKATTTKPKDIEKTEEKKSRRRRRISEFD